MRRIIVALSLLGMCLCGLCPLWTPGTPERVFGAETVGVRPYEMDWANRTADDFPPMIDFEKMTDWKCESDGVTASFVQSREQQLFGKYVAKLTYRKTGKGSTLLVNAPVPVPVAPEDFDAMSCWIYGNNWAWAIDATTPRVSVYAQFQSASGQTLSYQLAYVHWKEWFLCHKRFSPEEQAVLHEKVGGKSACFTGFKIVGATNKEDRAIYFDNFALFKERLEPLQLSVRAKRGIDMFPGQSSGMNTGEGRLPFPTREETILPESSADGSTDSVARTGDAFEMKYTGKDGTLVWRYEPKSGSWSDLQAKWNDSAWFTPLTDGGIRELALDVEKTEPVTGYRHLETKLDGKQIVTRWSLSGATKKATVEYRFQLRGKSLVLDTFAKGGDVPAIRFGTVSQIENARAFSIPYYCYGGANRPKAVVFDVPGAGAPLFILANVDWYRGNGSMLYGADASTATSASTNGRVAYNCKTDGTRNDVYERFFITIAPNFDETLPTIANPISPWKHVTGKKLWRAYGAGDRETDKKYWYNIWRHGMREVVVTDHETGWRDGGESFTFRTRPAPQKGGDKGQYDYTRYMRDTLGFTYGPYNNFTDFAPVNGNWNYDMPSRTTSGQLASAWARCYAPKPSKAVEFCEKYTPINQRKFNFSTAYCDVHTAVSPWSRVDYDARVPGAGTWAATFYPYGEIMLLQKKGWNGPVYSEGQHHCYYSGLTDGNYAQDQNYYFPTNAWLVDFDLLKIHDHECNFGMGNPGMYDPRAKGQKYTSAEWIEYLDRFFAATLAFGHPGFLAVERGVEGGMIGYFMLQQIAEHYTQSPVKSIRYLDEKGGEHTTSEAIARDILKYNQLVVRYADGTFVAVNGNESEPMTLALTLPERAKNAATQKPVTRDVTIPPNGYVAYTADYKVVVRALCENGKRYDYCDSPAYIFLNGRGTYQTMPKAAGAGLGVCRATGDNGYEIVALANAEMGFAIDADRAIALDFAGKELGAANIRHAGPYLFVEPVAGAFSYKLTKSGKTSFAGMRLASDRTNVVAGERVTAYDAAHPATTFELTVDKNASPGKMVWFEPVKGSFIGFFVVPMAEKTVALEGDVKLSVATRSNLPMSADRIGVVAKFNGVPLAGSVSGDTTSFTLPKPTGPGAENIRLEFVSGPFRESLAVKTSVKHETYRYPLGFEQDVANALVPTFWAQLRGQKPTNQYDEFAAAVYPVKNAECGETGRSGWFIHPPYRKGTGCTWVEFRFVVPKEPDYKPVFRAYVGKRNGSDLGDGILMKIVVVADGKEETLAEKTVPDHAWYPVEASLARYAGKEIVLRLVSDPGVKNNTAGDWSCWGDPRLESADKVFPRTLEPNPNMILSKTVGSNY